MAVATPATPATPPPGGSMAAPGVLATRLLPPRLPPGCVARPELAQRVRRGLQGRLVSIVAGAGYGKTTALVQALEGGPLPWVWLSLDPRLRSAQALVAHVTAGFARRFPGFAAGLALRGDAEALVASLANEVLATVPDELVLALDDVHALAPEPAAALAQLVGDLPPNVHLALTSRREPGFGSLAAGGTTAIGEELLAFSFEEAVALLADEPAGRGDAEVGQVHQRTEGWVAGMLLATRTDAPEGVGGSSGGSGGAGGPHFDYLAGGVLAALAPERQRFLLDSAVLERFTARLAAAVTGRADAREEIAALVADHLFIVQAEGDWHRYHHLFHAVLRRRLDEDDPERLRELHRRAAAAWLAEGEHQEAVRHLLRAGDAEAAADALEPVAEAMATSADAPTLANWLGELPDAVWQPRPRVRLAAAMLAYLGGRFEEAFHDWNAAIAGLARAGEQAAAAGALYRCQQAMVTAGVRPAARIEAAAPYEPWLERAGPAAAMVRMAVAIGYAIGCRSAEAETRIADALAAAGPRELALAGPCADLVRGYYLDFPAGRLAEAAQRIDRGLAALEPIETDDAGLLRAFGRGLRAALLAETGRYAEALVEADAVREQSAGIGMRAAPGLVILWWRLTSLSGSGAWEGVAALAPDAQRIVARAPGTNVAYRFPAALARLAAATGDRAGARARVAAAREALAGYGDSYEIPAVLCELALAADEAGEIELARGLADEGRAMAQRLGFGWYQARAALVGAHLHGAGAAGAERLAEALALTRRLGLDTLWTRRERPRAAALLARALADADAAGHGEAARLAVACGREVLHDCLERLADQPAAARVRLVAAIAPDADLGAHTMGMLLSDPDAAVGRAAAALRDAARRLPRAPIRIQTFGGLRVHRGETRVPDADFGRAKARSLLAALACAGPAGMHRERLVESLWPELPADRGGRAFDTTLHELRRTLEPLMPARSGGSLVVRDGELYRLVLGPRDHHDAGEFLAAARGLAGPLDDAELQRLLRAERLLGADGGDFLPEFAGEAWCEGTRRELARARVALLQRLAEALSELGRPAAAIERLRRLLAIDPEREGWHRALMRAYVQAGERPMALRQFHECRATLRGRLAIEPGPETRALYAALL